jgi:ribosomal protein S18 acetylase RimI-like enzyme
MAAIDNLVPLAPDQILHASEMLARAFHDDPPEVWLFPDEARRRRVLRWDFGVALRYGLRYGETYTTPGHPEAVAVWLPPDRPLTSTIRMIIVGGVAAPFVLGFTAFRRFLSLSGLMEKLHKRDVPKRHWYLMVLGVDPPRQGQGVGGDLIQPVLALADRDELPCYLETSKEINVRFYEKHGFEVVVEGDLPGGAPKFWTMKRDPVR